MSVFRSKVAPYGMALTLSLVALSACTVGETAKNTTLVDKSFTALSFIATSADGSGNQLIKPVVVSFTVDEVNVDTPCNDMGGSVEYSAERLKVGPIASTLIGCEMELAEQDKRIADLLSSEPSWFLDSNLLTLEGGGLKMIAELASAETGDNILGQENVPSSFADTMFAMMMIPHHAQAVRMGELATTRSTDPFIRGIATEIGDAQASEIEIMRSWLAEWGANELSEEMAKAHEGHMGMEGMLSDEQFTALENAEGALFDRLFAEYMIEHHQGAVSMAKDVLAAGKDPRVKKFAQEVIRVQEEEILAMRDYLNRR